MSQIEGEKKAIIKSLKSSVKKGKKPKSKSIKNVLFRDDSLSPCLNLKYVMTGNFKATKD